MKEKKSDMPKISIFLVHITKFEKSFARILTLPEETFYNFAA
jgi:hypothetical protein